MYFMGFMILKHWKQPNCPSIKDGLHKVKHTYTNDLYTTVIKDYLGHCL